MAQELLKSGAHANFRNLDEHTAIHKAVERGNLPLVEDLMKHGGDANVTGQVRCKDRDA